MAKRYLGVARDLNNTELINVSDPGSATSAATKQYVDNKVAGLSWKEECRAATTANITISTALNNGDTLDGITLATNDRVLVKNQTAQTENGIYVVAASPGRATDADSTADLNNMTVFVTEGTVNSGLAFTQTTKNPVIATDNIVFVQFNAGTTYTASLGVTLSGTDFRLAAAAAGSALTLTSGVLDVVAGTSLEISSDTIRIAAAAAGAGLIGGGASALAVGAGSGITVNADDVAVDSTVSRRFSTGTHSSATSVAITHSLGVQFCSGVSVYVTSTGEMVDCDITATSTTVMTFVFAVAPSSNTLTFVIST